MTLIDAALKILKRDMKNVIRMEKEDPTFLNQEDYISCKARVQHGMDIASENAINFITLNVCKHRDEKHDRDTLPEQTSLLSLMPAEDIELEATVQSAWRD